MKQRIIICAALFSLILLNCESLNRIPGAPTPALISIANPSATDTPTQASNSASDPLYPELGNHGYDARHYAIELNVDVKKDFINGTCTLEALAAQNLDTFSLDIHGLDVGGVTVNTSPPLRVIGFNPSPLNSPDNSSQRSPY